MEIILSNLCDSLTGSLCKKHGYSIRQSRDGRFYGKRNSKGKVPQDGHLRFILDCANMAQNKLFIADIHVSHQELSEALSEAGLPSSGARHDSAEFLSSSDILALKERMSL